ncbi:MAG: hypothetical protein KJ000_35460, partial [Pirellulaceae bacterium]|nr:hypothetical protein [Pirellulaceae bacterium]
MTSESAFVLSALSVPEYALVVIQSGGSSMRDLFASHRLGSALSSFRVQRKESRRRRSRQNRTLLLEPLEVRHLLTSDLLPTDNFSLSSTHTLDVSEPPSSVLDSAEWYAASTWSASTAEGEAFDYGYDNYGYDNYGYDSYGYDSYGYDSYGYDSYGY